MTETSVYRCVIELHDYFFFASRESNGVATTLPLIHNSALLYAINEDISTTQRLVSGTRPYYDEDRPRFTSYATPARTLGSAQTVKISYNAVDDPLLFSVEQSILKGERKYVVPRYGAYHRFVPQAWVDGNGQLRGELRFEFYMIGPRPRRVIRIGKKRAAARLLAEEAASLQVREGEFEPDHFVSFSDLPDRCSFSLDHIIDMLPWPLLENTRLRGQYVVAEFRSQRAKRGSYDDGRRFIALPDTAKFSGVDWSALFQQLAS